VPYIVIGIVLVYLSFYGVEGFGLTLTGDLYKEDFDTFTGWSPFIADGGQAPIINPPGQLQEIAGTAAGDTRSAAEDSHKVASAGDAVRGETQYTVEFRMKADVWGSGTNGPGYTAFMFFDDTYVWVASIFQSSIRTLDSKIFTFSPTDNGWHIYTFVVSITNAATSTGTVEIWLDQTKIGSCGLSVFTGGGAAYAKISIDSHDGITMHADYVYVDEGLKPPSGSIPPPPTYSDVTISVSGQGTTAPAAGHYATTYLVGGSLTITATPASGWAFDYMTRNGATAPSMTLNSLAATEQVVVYFKTGPPTTGTLRVFASYNGAYVVASITASGPQTVYGSTTTSSTNPLAFTVTAGTYAVSGTYASGSASPVQVTVPAGGSVDAPLNFGGSLPTPDFLAAIITAIKNFLNQFAVKSILMVVGVALTIGGSIMFLLKGKGERSRPAPIPYY